MNKKKRKYSIKSIRRAVQILNLFSIKKTELGITEISKCLNLSKSTVFRFLINLEEYNLLKKEQSNKKYRLGLKLFELGNIVQSQMEIKHHAYNVMKDLVCKTKESVYLNIIVDGKRVIIEKIESMQDIRRVIQIGQYLPLYCGASSRALLAFLSDDEIDTIIKREKLIPLGPNTITDPIKLKEKLKEVRRKGYAISFEERVLGSVTISMPIFNVNNKVVASLTVSGPISRLNRKKITEFIPLVKNAAKKISSSLGSKYYSS